MPPSPRPAPTPAPEAMPPSPRPPPAPEAMPLSPSPAPSPRPAPAAEAMPPSPRPAPAPEAMPLSPSPAPAPEVMPPSPRPAPTPAPEAMPPSPACPPSLALEDKNEAVVSNDVTTGRIAAFVPTASVASVINVADVLQKSLHIPLPDNDEVVEAPPTSCAQQDEQRCEELTTALILRPWSCPAAAPQNPAPATPSSQREWQHERSLFDLFGEDEELLNNCSALLSHLQGFQASMLETHSRVASLCGSEQWATAAMGPQIWEFCALNPEDRGIFDDAVTLWLKSHECIGHAIFVLMTRQIPPHFAGEAKLLGSFARDFLRLLAQWQWVLSSGMLSTWQLLRYESALPFSSLGACGGKDAVPRVLVVPYFGIFHDLRLRRADVLLALSDAGLFDCHELEHVLPELIDAATARNAAMVEASMRQKEQQQQQQQQQQDEGLEDPFYDDLLA